jgi:hypothetical protein
MGAFVARPAIRQAAVTAAPGKIAIARLLNQIREKRKSVMSGLP